MFLDALFYSFQMFLDSGGRFRRLMKSIWNADGQRWMKVQSPFRSTKTNKIMILKNTIILVMMQEHGLGSQSKITNHLAAVFGRAVRTSWVFFLLCFLTLSFCEINQTRLSPMAPLVHVETCTALNYSGGIQNTHSMS